MRNIKWRVQAGVVLISLCQGLQYTISPVLNKIQQEYPNVAMDYIQMLVTIPALLSMVAAILSSILVYRFPKKSMVILGAFLSGICGCLPLFVEGFAVIFFSRVIYGIGLGLVTVLNTAIIAEYFEGRERGKVLGIQGASVGCGILLTTTIGGMIGRMNYQFVYYLHIFGILSAVFLYFLLPKGRVEEKKEDMKHHFNGKVYKTGFLGIVEFIFLMAFTSNLALHLGGRYAGDAGLAGMLSGVFSGSQIAIGCVISQVFCLFKEKTLYAAMMCFGAGSILLVLFPGNLVPLTAAAVFCGLSQGIFTPRAMYEVTEAVEASDAAMASAFFTICMYIGQFLSPVMLNVLTKVFFGSTRTTDIFFVCSLGMIVIPVLFMLLIYRKKTVV